MFISIYGQSHLILPENPCSEFCKTRSRNLSPASGPTAKREKDSISMLLQTDLCFIMNGQDFLFLEGKKGFIR